MQMSLLQAQEILLLRMVKCNGLKQSILEKLCKSPCTVNQANRQTSSFFHKGQTYPAVRKEGKKKKIKNEGKKKQRQYFPARKFNGNPFIECKYKDTK